MNKLIWISIIGGLVLLKSIESEGVNTKPPGSSAPTGPNPPSAPIMISPVGGVIIRNDPAGGGCYLCSRGSRKHHGVDLLADQYQDVVSPISGIMSRHFFVYQNDKKYTGCEIIGTGRHEGLKIKLMYMVPSNYIGQQVQQGEYIGFMQSINDKYPGQGMLDHIHMEVYWNGVRVDPGRYLKLLQ